MLIGFKKAFENDLKSEGIPKGAISGYFWGWFEFKKNVLGSSQIVELLLFSLFHSILTFESNIILGLFFTFLGTSGHFLGSG